MSVTCLACGHRNADGVQFCRQCGAYLPWEGRRTAGTPDLTGLHQRQGLSVQLEEQALAVSPGEVVTVTATLRNTGTRVEGVRVGIGGPARAWARVEPADLSVYPDKTVTCTVTFAPPRGSQVPAGIVGFVVQCVSTVQRGVMAMANGTVAVGAVHDLSAELVPAVTRGRRRTEHQVRLENRGNVVERIRLTAADTEGALAFDLAEPQVDVPPGRRDVRLGVRAKWHWFGRSLVMPIQTTAVPLTGGPPLRADGTRYVVPLIPTWALTAALVLAVLGGGGATALRLAGGESTPSVEATETPIPTGEPVPTTEAQSVAETTPPPKEEPEARTTTPPPVTTTTTGQAEPTITNEDCIRYDPGALRVVSAGADGFQVFEGTSRAMLLLDDETDARNAKSLAERHTSLCFLGRDNERENRAEYVVYYWRGSSGKKTTIEPEDCVTYDPAELRLVNIGADGFQLVAGGSQALLLLDDEADARNSLKWAKAFTRQCFIGRDNERPDRSRFIVGYWKP